MSDQPQAQDAFDRFVAECHKLAQKLTPNDSNLRIFIHPHRHPRVLADAAEKTQQFSEVAETISRLAPPDSIGARALADALYGGHSPLDGVPPGLIEAIKKAREWSKKRAAGDHNAEEGWISKALANQSRIDLKHYLRRAGFYQQVLLGSKVEFGTLLD